ncbi:hypothetical protein CMT22_17710 [Elizabethkingia anophelis]|nr:hypothetical protein [Elizabethkingia anophelis]
MENSHIYYINIIVPGKSVDKDWSFLQFETTFNLIVGDIINLKNHIDIEDLVNDYKTKTFKIMGRGFILDEDNETSGGIMLLEVVPV